MELDERNNLGEPAFRNVLEKIEDRLKITNVTLLYAAKDEVNNHAVILHSWLRQELGLENGD